MSLKIKRNIIAILFVFALFILGISGYEKNIAFAGSRYQLTYEEPVVTTYVAGGQTVTRKVFVSKELHDNFIRIKYDVVSSDSNEIMLRRLSPNKGKVSGDHLTIEREGVIVKGTDLIQNGSTGKYEDAYYFEVSSDHCCAFIFTVYYTAGDEEEVNYDSSVLYLTTIDDTAPTVTVKEINRFLYSITCSFKDDGSVCASSGVKSYTVYREDLTTKEEEEFLTSEVIYKNSASFTLESGKYNYYVTATDAVGNTSEKVLVATFDVDELIRSADNAFNTISSSPDDWSENFKNKLEKAYSEYVIASGDLNGNVTEADLKKKSDALTSVLSEYRKYIAEKLNGNINIKLRVNNGSYFPEPPAVTNLAKACDFVRYGEEGTLTISIGQYDSASGMEDALAQVGMEKVNKVYTFSMQLFSAERLTYEDTFSIPLKIAVYPKEYEKLAAVQVTEEDGVTVYTPCAITEYTDGTVVLNIKKTYGEVYLFVTEKENNYSLLYLLFLLIPIGSGIAAIIILKKRKKEADKKEEPKEEVKTEEVKAGGEENARREENAGRDENARRDENAGRDEGKETDN